MGWYSCQINNFSLFQLGTASAKVRCLTIRRLSQTFSARALPSCPHSREEPCLVYSEDTATVFVIGGTAFGECFSNVYSYSFRESKWSERPPLLQERHIATACTLKDTIFVFGGLDSEKRFITSAERYTISAEEWQTIELPLADFTPRLEPITFSISNHEIIILGGCHERNSYSTEATLFDTRTLECKKSTLSGVRGFMGLGNKVTRTDTGRLVAAVLTDIDSSIIIEFNRSENKVTELHLFTK